MSEYIKKCVRTYLTIYFKMVFIKCQLFLNKENYYFEKREPNFIDLDTRGQSEWVQVRNEDVCCS